LLLSGSSERSERFGLRFKIRIRKRIKRKIKSMKDAAEINTTSANDRVIAANQAFLGVVILLVFTAMVGIAQVAVAHDDLVLPHRVAKWKQTTGMYADQRYFQGAEDRLLYSVLPSADYSKGGVYFTGASMTERSLMPWDWPAEDQRRIHNYCIAGATHSRQAEFIRYLVEHENLLQAGGNKTVICTELLFGGACRSNSPEFLEIDDAWKSFFEHYRLYRLDPENGIEPISRWPVPRWMSIASIKTNLFFNWAEQFIDLSLPNPYLVPGNKMEPSAARAYWSRRAGPNWESSMDEQLQQYAELIDYLQSKRVTVVGIYMPEGRWFDGFPPAVGDSEKKLPQHK